MEKGPHQTFQWHDETILRGLEPTEKKVSPSPVAILNDIHFITDVDCESTLVSLRQTLNDKHAFCVVPQKFQPPDKRGIEPSDCPCAIFECLTAGSNGQPKRIRRSQSSWIASFNINAHIASIDTNDSYAIIGRLSHSIALYAALEAAYLGADIHAFTELRPDKQLQALAQLQSSVLYATPTQLRLLCGSVKACDLSSIQQQLQVRAIFCGGGKLDQRTRKLVETVFQSTTIREFYGASETSFITMSDDQTPIGSVGKAYPSVQLLIKHIDNLEITASHDNGVTRWFDSGVNSTVCNNSCGEIWVKSPYIFQSYSDSSAQVARWCDGYISVGEIGHLDSSGNLYLDGRQSRRVNIADTIVYPEEVENILNEHAAVIQSVVIAVADEKRGHVLIAMVEAQRCDTLKQDLLVYLRKCVGNLKAPRDIVFVTSLPLLASGKPDMVLIEQQLNNAAQFRL